MNIEDSVSFNEEGYFVKKKKAITLGVVVVTLIVSAVLLTYYLKPTEQIHEVTRGKQNENYEYGSSKASQFITECRNYACNNPSKLEGKQLFSRIIS